MNRVLCRRPDHIASILLLLLFGLLIFSIALKSPTLDEQNHIARGLAWLKTGDLRLSQEHPPGVNAWEAWPLLLDPNVNLPLDNPSWANAEWYGFADQLLWRVNDGATRARMLMAARAPVMWLTLLLAAVVYRWAKMLSNGWGGLLAMSMLIFDPNILAHGRLTTTDMGVTCLAVVSIFALWRAQNVDRWPRWLFAGATLGLAMGTKFSALLLAPVIALLVIAARTSARPHLSMREKMGRLAILFATSLLVLWAVYGFEWGTSDLLGNWPLPAPSFIDGLHSILERTGGGSTAFLIGRYSERGWWTFFPIAFAIKTPLPTLALLGAAIILALKSKTSPAPYSHLIVPALAFGAMAIASGFNIGYRHILPVLPFSYIAAGAQIANHKSIRRSPFAVRGLLLAVCCLLFATINILPNYLAFFNLVAGGPGNGYRYLVDSNLDWGQDLPALARWVKQHNVQRINLSWFGAAHPEMYDFDFNPLPGFWRFGGDPAAYGFNPYRPAPGIYAISASNLQGIKLADRDTFAWFRAQAPLDHIGHSILIYEVKPAPPPRQALVLQTPMTQLSQPERALLREGASVRQFDPASGAIWPAVERVWFVTREPLAWGKAARRKAGYVVTAGAWSEAEPRFRQARPCDADTRFGRLIALRRYQVPNMSLARDETLTVTAWWTVIDRPRRPATSFAHLLDAQGRYVAGWDGLTAPATCWQPGDLVEQIYAIPLPDDLAPAKYQLEIGWYDAESVQRWPLTVGGAPGGDRLLIADVEIGP